ncbi:MAG: hypothetical protein A2474_07215 [Elusimicrobia bacterium RIFOXYC2_FULL_34_12]|nr:MAG: hypothetical protein A2474_07215 [Elusimicrobia bacterium RIFOXYC2_FULL_34_12]OGS39453.1 MAG: hypothetical protein A2551_01195 [Elusimicrobia bacterium RIFOXYD2_FULL_34_30]HAM39423.1 RluA family pseudouridine synthase [Elusimicrobiota bacterium]
MENQEKVISDKEKMRLDNFLKEKYPDYSRGYFQRLIKNGFVKINGKFSQSGNKLRLNDVIDIEFVSKEEKILPAEIPIDIIYEDKDIIVINKQPNLVVHPAGRHKTDTLVNGLLYYFKGKLAPFLIHRLDKDTSGVIVVAKTEIAKEFLSRQFHQRMIDKKYLTIVNCVIKESEGTIDAPIGRSNEDRKKFIVGSRANRESKTFFKVIKRFKNTTYLEVKPYTGRTHQIRVHLAYIGHPVLGDTEYGIQSELANRQLLHASSIGFLHPKTKKKVEFSASLPEDFKKALKILEAENIENI